MNIGITKLIAGYLDPYVVPGYRFNIGWNSTISMQNLVLRPDLLANLQIPLKVCSGIIGEISIEGLFSGQVMLHIQQVVLEVAPGRPTPTHNDTGNETKESTEATTTNTKNTSTTTTTTTTETETKRNIFITFLKNKLTQLGMNVQLEITHIEVRYRDVLQGERFALCASLDHISLRTKDGKLEIPDVGYQYDSTHKTEYFDPSRETTLVKLLSIAGLTLYFEGNHSTNYQKVTILEPWTLDVTCAIDFKTHNTIDMSTVHIQANMRQQNTDRNSIRGSLRMSDLKRLHAITTGLSEYGDYNNTIIQTPAEANNVPNGSETKEDTGQVEQTQQTEGVNATESENAVRIIICFAMLVPIRIDIQDMASVTVGRVQADVRLGGSDIIASVALPMLQVHYFANYLLGPKEDRKVSILLDTLSITFSKTTASQTLGVEVDSLSCHIVHEAEEQTDEQAKQQSLMAAHVRRRRPSSNQLFTEDALLSPPPILSLKQLAVHINPSDTHECLYAPVDVRKIHAYDNPACLRRKKNVQPTTDISCCVGSAVDIDLSLSDVSLILESLNALSSTSTTTPTTAAHDNTETTYLNQISGNVFKKTMGQPWPSSF